MCFIHYFSNDFRQIPVQLIDSTRFELNPNGLVQVEIEMEMAKYRCSQSLTFLDFLEGDFGQFPTNSHWVCRKTVRGSEKKYCHGPN